MHAQAGRRFRVVVADARLQLEGRQLLSRLLRAGIPCTYVLLNALSYIITVRRSPDCTASALSPFLLAAHHASLPSGPPRRLLFCC